MSSSKLDKLKLDRSEENREYVSLVLEAHDALEEIQ